MSCKFTIQECWEIFSFLDKDNDGDIDYNEFCNITEEWWREIDPFDVNSNRAVWLWELFKSKDNPYNSVDNIKPSISEKVQAYWLKL